MNGRLKVAERLYGRCRAAALHGLQFPPDSTTILFVLVPMTSENLLLCDGCGQRASEEHIGRRLARLECTTRFRPVHIGTLLLGAIAPGRDLEFLYAPAGGFAGEAGIILGAAGISHIGKSVEVTLAEFQRSGLFLTHVLECPLEPGLGSREIVGLLGRRFPEVLARIRRSLKPKRVIPISGLLEPLLRCDGRPPEVGCPVVLEGQKPFALDGEMPEVAGAALRRLLAEAGVAR